MALGSEIEIEIKLMHFPTFNFDDLFDVIAIGMVDLHFVLAVGKIGKFIVSVGFHTRKVRRFQGENGGVHMFVNVASQFDDTYFIDPDTLGYSGSPTADVEAGAAGEGLDIMKELIFVKKTDFGTGDDR